MGEGVDVDYNFDNDDGLRKEFNGLYISLDLRKILGK